MTDARHLVDKLWSYCNVLRVDSALRHRLLAEARREGRAVGQLLDAMLAERERAQSFAQLGRAIANTPTEVLEDWRAESAAFDAASQDGLPDA